MTSVSGGSTVQSSMRNVPLLQTLRSSTRYLQSSAPLPPLASPLPPSQTASSAVDTSLAHLPAILPRPAQPSLPTTIPEAIRLLKSQSTQSSGIYCVARLYSRTFLLHSRDIIALPRLREQPPPGTILNLTRIQEVGSREFAIRAPSADSKILRRHMDFDARTLPDIPRGVVSCSLTVLEHTKSPMEERFKMKRRKGYRKTIKAKHNWTRVKVGDIILGPEPWDGQVVDGMDSVERMMNRELQQQTFVRE